jgi:hypothetical protein
MQLSCFHPLLQLQLYKAGTICAIQDHLLQTPHHHDAAKVTPLGAIGQNAYGTWTAQKGLTPTSMSSVATSQILHGTEIACATICVSLPLNYPVGFDQDLYYPAKSHDQGE